MIRNIFIRATLTISLICIAPSLILARPDVHAQLENIGIELNHQNFIKAQELRVELMKDLPIDSLAKDLSYSDFILLIQTISWDSKSDDFYELIRSREIYHPGDTQKAALLTRKDRDAFWKTCQGIQDTFLDTMDLSFCIISNPNIDSFFKKIMLGNSISKNYNRAILSKDLQDMSDLGNFISSYISFDPSKKRQYLLYQKKLGFLIVSKDPAWINGYFLILPNTKNRMERNKLIQKLKDNYLGDSDRWKNAVQPYLDSLN